MVRLRIQPLDIPNSADHIATDWQVSDKINFQTRLLESMNDRTDLLVKTWTTVLDPSKKYYARARALINGRGYTVWGNLDVFTSFTGDVDAGLEDIPTAVATPRVSTNSNYSKHSVTLFTIYANGFSIIGNATHTATTWIIEKLDGTVVWVKEYDTINKNSIQVVDTVLEQATYYRIRVIYHASTFDVSQVGSCTIYTQEASDETSLSIQQQIYSFVLTLDNVLNVPVITGVEHTVRIYKIENGVSKEVYKHKTASPNIPIPANTLEKGYYYGIFIEYENGDSVYAGVYTALN